MCLARVFTSHVIRAQDAGQRLGFQHTQPPHTGQSEPSCERGMLWAGPKGLWFTSTCKHRLYHLASGAPSSWAQPGALPVHWLGVPHTGWGTHGRKGRSPGLVSLRTKGSEGRKREMEGKAVLPFGAGEGVSFPLMQRPLV